MLSLLYGQALTYICNFAKEAKVEWFYEDLQDLLGLTTCPLTPRQRKKKKEKKTTKDFLFSIQFSSVQFSSVAHPCPTLCDPMDCSTPGLPVHHQLQEFTQTHVHC